MEARLEKRYNQLVKSHMQSNSELAAGVKSLLKDDIAFNQTQAAWRFFNNEKCNLMELAAPLLEAAHKLSSLECESYSLVVHDWSHLSYDAHKTKTDRFKNNTKVGYELQSSLIVSDVHGGPLSLAAMNLKTNTALHSSYCNNKQLKTLTHLEEATARIHWLEEQKFPRPLVHIIDREADSVGFLRDIGDFKWLIRANGRYFVEHAGIKKKIHDIEQELIFESKGKVSFKGKPAQQLIAETSIRITRPAKLRKYNDDGSRKAVVPGTPICCRLIMTQIVDKDKNILAIWYLLTNISDISPEKIALWYYWRWSIESYFKLMKSAGMQLESWKQTKGIAIARRILVASMACVTVWRIACAKGEDGAKVRKILVRLSGRQMRWGKQYTHSALLAGLWCLLSIQITLETFSLDEIKSLISSVFRKEGFV